MVGSGGDGLNWSGSGQGKKTFHKIRKLCDQLKYVYLWKNTVPWNQLDGCQLVSLVQVVGWLVHIFCSIFASLRTSTKTGFHSLTHTYIIHPNLLAQLLLDFLALKMKAPWSFKTTATHTTRSRNIPGDLNLQQHCCEFLLVQNIGHQE